MKKLSLLCSVLLTLVINFNCSSASNLIEAGELKESLSPLCNLPTELKEHIFTYLDDTKGFIQLSHANHNLREVAYKAGKDKSIDLSHRKFDDADYDALIEMPLAKIILCFRKLNKDILPRIFNSSIINQRSRINIDSIETVSINKKRTLCNDGKSFTSVEYSFCIRVERLTSSHLYKNYNLQQIIDLFNETQFSNFAFGCII